MPWQGHSRDAFIFQEIATRDRWNENSAVTKELSFNVATWSQGGLRYFVIGDASAADIDNLAKLFKATGS